jgi:hypothetical protein
MILIAYDGSKDARSVIEHAGELMSGEKATVFSVWERFIDVMTRSGWGLGLALGIVDFEGIDKASEESARERAAEGARGVPVWRPSHAHESETLRSPKRLCPRPTRWEQARSYSAREG